MSSNETYSLAVMRPGHDSLGHSLRWNSIVVHGILLGKVGGLISHESDLEYHMERGRGNECSISDGPESGKNTVAPAPIPRLG